MRIVLNSHFMNVSDNSRPLSMYFIDENKEPMLLFPVNSNRLHCLSQQFEITFCSFVFNQREKKRMVGKVELIPIYDGNRITVRENEKIIIGRGSSLGVCT
jgi:hypothetical protein